MNSMGFRNLIIYIPAVLAIPIVKWKIGTSKFSIAEYLGYMKSGSLKSVVSAPDGTERVI